MGTCPTKRGDATSYEQIKSASEMAFDEKNMQMMQSISQQSSDSYPSNENGIDNHKRQRRYAYKNYRIGIVSAYLYSVQKILYLSHQNENKSFYRIPSSITSIILSFLPPYFQIFGIGKNLVSNNEISEFERLHLFETKLSSPNDIFIGHDKYFIKSYVSEIYAIGSSSFDGLCLNSSDSTTTTNNYYDLKHNINLYKNFDFVDLNEQIDIISNSHYSNDIIIKLKNGSIYTSQLSMNSIGEFHRKFIKPAFNDLSVNKNLEIIDIKCGLLHCLFLANNGTLYANGGNNNGQLGFGYLSQRESQIKIVTTFIEEDIKITSINCGEHHSAAIDHDGNLWAWGLNKNNQCCSIKNGQTMDVIVAKPSMVFLNTKRVKKVECGETFTVLLDDQGYYDGFGKMIVSTLDRVNIKNWDIKGMKFKDISCGKNHVMLIGEDDEIYVHGSNEFFKGGLKIGRAGKPMKVKYDRLPNDLQPCRVIAGGNNSVIIFNSVSD